MPLRKYGKGRRKAGVRRRFNRRANRALMFNPRPIFTESFALPKTGGQYALDPNTGGILAVSMDNMPQLNQYAALYQKYRILKAKFICIPTYNTASADVNSAQPAGGLQQVGLSRVVYAVNDSPNQVTIPAAESDVLRDNGCKIACGSPKLVMSCRPVPDTLDSNGNRTTVRGKYLNFVPVNASHYGITWFHSQAVLPPGQGFGVPYLVYCKLTFQLADPR
jgi:hypothetical protein